MGRLFYMAGYYEHVIRFRPKLISNDQNRIYVEVCLLTVSRSQIPRLNAEKSV